jgi:hypothetical protein
MKFDFPVCLVLISTGNTSASVSRPHALSSLNQLEAAPRRRDFSVAFALARHVAAIVPRPRRKVRVKHGLNEPVGKPPASSLARIGYSVQIFICNIVIFSLHFCKTNRIQQ